MLIELNPYSSSYMNQLTLLAANNSRSKIVYQQALLIIQLNNHQLQLALNLLNSIMQFDDHPIYTNILVQKVEILVKSYTLWTSFMNLFNFIVEDGLFDSAGLVFLLGMFLLFVVISFRKEYRYDLLTNNTYKLELNRLKQHINFLEQITRFRTSDIQYSIMLDGFIDYHQSICNFSQCPSKKTYSKNKKNTQIVNIQDNNKSSIQMIFLIDYFYSLSVQKYPADSELKLAHSLFMFYRIQNKQQAINELFRCAELHKSMFIQFQIQRFVRMIQKEINTSFYEQQNIAERNYNQYINQLKRMIETNCSLYIQFWGKLKEQSPNFRMIQKIGKQLLINNKSINQIQQYLNSLNMFQTNRLYSQYLLNILNDPVQSEKVLRQLHQNISYSQDINFNQQESIDISQIGEPLVYISADDDQLGTIVNINMEASVMFGYLKQELINKKVNILMPQIYSQYHDQFIENYLQNYEPRVINRFRLFPFKNKNNYIQPYQMKIMNLNILNKMQFVGHIKKEKQFKNHSYVLIDNSQGNIKYISSSCISILGLDQSNIENIQISSILPQFFNETQEFLAKQGCVTKVITNFDSGQLEQLMKVNCYEVSFKLQGYSIQHYILYNRLQGYLFRFEPVIMQDTPLDYKPKHPLQNPFCMQYKMTQGIYSAYIQEIPQKDQLANNNNMLRNAMNGHENAIYYPIDEYGIVHQTIKSITDVVTERSQVLNESFYIQRLDQQSHRKQQENVVKINRDDIVQGIRTMRLIQGRIIDIEEFKKDESEEDVMMVSQETNKGLQQQEEDQEISSRVIFKNSSNFEYFIEESNKNQLISGRYLLLIVLLYFLELGLATGSYFAVHDSIKQIDNTYYIVHKSGRRMTYMQCILFTISQINQISIIDQYKLNTDSVKKEIEAQKGYLREYLQKIQKVQVDLGKEGTILQGPGIARLLYTNSVEMKSMELGQVKTQYYDINEATNQITTKILELRQQPVEQFRIENEYFYYVYYNLLNNYQIELNHIYNLQVKALYDIIRSPENASQTFLGFSFAIMFGQLILYVMIYIYLVINNSQIFMVFQEIPQNNLKQYQDQAEQFQSSMKNEEEELESNTDESIDEETTLNMNIKKNRKSKTSANKNQVYEWKVIVKMVLIVLTGWSYFAIDFGIAYQIHTIHQRNVAEFNITNSLESQVYLMTNMMHNFIMNPNTEVNNGYGGNEMMKFQNQKLYNYLSQMELVNVDNQDIHPAEYSDLNSKVLKRGSCIYFEQITNIPTQQCIQFQYGLVEEGLSIALSNQFQNFEYLRQLLQFYSTNELKFVHDYYIQNTQNRSLPMFSNNVTLNNYMLSYTSYKFESQKEFQQAYLMKVFNHLAEQYLRLIHKESERVDNVRVFLLVGLGVFIALVVLLWWKRIADKMESDIKDSKKIIMNIPLALIWANRSIRDKIQEIFQIVD